MKELPFLSEFRIRIMIGAKTWTCRTSKKAEPGELVVAYPGDGQIILRIVNVFRMHLRDIAAAHFSMEGCASPDEFKIIWRRLHPRKGFDPDQLVWVHEFVRHSV